MGGLHFKSFGLRPKDEPTALPPIPPEIGLRPDTFMNRAAAAARHAFLTTASFSSRRARGPLRTLHFALVRASPLRSAPASS